MIIHENNWRLTIIVTKQKNRKSSSTFLIYLLSYCEQKSRKLKLKIQNSDSQRNGQKDQEKKKFGKILFLKNIFLKIFLINSF